jgi:hypothetical protein
MSAKAPLMDADDLRKNVSGTVFGSMPESLTWDSKLVICATTRHGAVTGETSSRSVSGTDSPAAAAAMAARSASSSAVDPAVVAIRAAPDAVFTHQASAVRSTDVVMNWQLSVGRSGGGRRTHCGRAGR